MRTTDWDLPMAELTFDNLQGAGKLKAWFEAQRGA